MRIIPVDEYGDWGSVASVLSIMLFPEDGALQIGCDSAITWTRKLDQLSSDEETVISRHDLKAILDAPSLTEVNSAMSKQAVIGQIAGELLILALQIDKSDGGTSLRKARFLVSSRNKLINDSQDKKLWASDASLKKAWSRFRSVAHLWGALRLLTPEKMDKFGAFAETLTITDILESLSSNPLDQFVITSKWILELATGITPQHQTGTGRSLVEADAAWTIPSEFGSRPDADSLPALPHWASSLLGEYRRDPADN